ncbi:hypothetical protein ACFL96_18450 [Thermoproteota archaeon]
MGIQWPIKILLAHPQTPFLKNEKFIIATDWVVFSSNDFKKRQVKNEDVVIGCSILEDPDKMMSKIALMVKETSAKNIDVYTIEVPCCHAIHMMVQKAINESGKDNTDKKIYC